MDKIKGKVWILGDNVDTDQILPGYAMAEDVENLGKFAMCGSELDNFSELVSQGDVIVAGKNFGCGSSREQAPVALKQAGVGAVIAESFARIFRRNAINIGLPVIMGSVKPYVAFNDEIAIDLEESYAQANGKKIKLTPLSQSSYETIQAGGLINRVREELKQKGKI